MNKLLQLLKEIKEEAINEQKKYFSINSVIETLDAAIDIYLVSKERRKAKVKARVGVMSKIWKALGCCVTLLSTMAATGH